MMKDSLTGKIPALMIAAAALILQSRGALAGPAFEVVAGCQEADYVLVEGDAVVKFQGMGYTPRCLAVRAGSSVTLPGSSNHPLQGLPNVGGVVNPFASGAEQTVSVTQQLKVEGFYGYFCTKHIKPDGTGMVGAIRVIEAKQP